MRINTNFYATLIIHLWSVDFFYVFAILILTQCVSFVKYEKCTYLEAFPPLSKLHPKFNITIADESPAAVEYLKQEISISGLSEKIEVKKTDLNHLAFDDSQFDLVVFRGAFFFLKEKGNLLQEVFRVLKDGGIAFIGGGFGKGTPQELIDEIADESRELNDRLGRRRVSIKELEEMIRKSKLTDKCQIEEDGGVWLNIKK